jgi:MFS transporter, PAT family, beta-lactamase induction signal transducer AmpG
MASRRGLARKLGVLWTLYFVQGLPFGFQATALPVYLRASGFSLTAVGFASALALPWMLKMFWAPLVDRFGSRKFGRRRSWIVPLQVLLALTAFAGAFATGQERITLLLVVVFLMNLFAATMDIAVDGLAVDILELPELGKGNVAQVVGYKVGMLTGGGLLVWASGWIGWEGLFIAMGALTAAALSVSLLFRERYHRDPKAPGSPLEHPSLRSVLGLLGRSLRSPTALWLLLFVGTYKFGETMVDTLFKPFLFDVGFGREQIGLWVGTWGMLFSIVGSIAGGYAATRWPLLRAVAVTAALRVLPVAGEWWLTVVDPTAGKVIFITCAEHFFGGALTTAMFAYMMSRVDRRIGATHYTMLASIEVWGKLPAAWIAGIFADLTSYFVVFGTGTILSILFLALLIPLAREKAAPPETLAATG